MRELYIPALMPDEFISGYLGRIACINGYKSDRPSRLALRKWHDYHFPGKPCTTLTTQLADANGIDTFSFAKHHTLIPIIRAVSSFLAEQRHGDPNGHGLLWTHGSRILRNDLQFCTECINEDLDYHGFSYWRRSHQLPGIDWCTKHAVPLLTVSTTKSLWSEPATLKTYKPSYVIHDSDIENNPTLNRYAETLSFALDLDHPIVPAAISKHLGLKAIEMGLRRYPKGDNPTLSDLALRSLPASWLARHFPKLTEKRTGMYLYEYDGVCSTSGKAHPSTSYILAAAILSKTSAESIQFLNTAYHVEKEILHPI